jgi:hypothetical protein
MDDEQLRKLTVLDFDGCKSGAGADRAPADASTASVVGTSGETSPFMGIQRSRVRRDSVRLSSESALQPDDHRVEGAP